MTLLRHGSKDGKMKIFISKGTLRQLWNEAFTKGLHTGFELGKMIGRQEKQNEIDGIKSLLDYEISAILHKTGMDEER